VTTLCLIWSSVNRDVIRLYNSAIRARLKNFWSFSDPTGLALFGPTGGLPPVRAVRAGLAILTPRGSPFGHVTGLAILTRHGARHAARHSDPTGLAILTL